MAPSSLDGTRCSAEPVEKLVLSVPLTRPHGKGDQPQTALTRLAEELLERPTTAAIGSVQATPAG